MVRSLLALLVAPVALGLVTVPVHAQSSAASATADVVGELGAPAADAAASRADLALRLSPASPGAVRFTVTVPDARFVEEPGATDGAVRVDLAGFDAFGDPGAPPLQRRVVTIAIPPLGPVRVSAVASDLVTREGTLLAPQPGIDRQGGAHEVPRTRAYTEAGSGTPVGARLLRIEWMRNQRVAIVALEPAAYEGASRRLTVARRIDVDVQVQPLGALGEPFEKDDPFERVYRTSLVNYEQGRAWRRPATRVLVETARRLGLNAEAAVLASAPDTGTVIAGRMWVKIAVRSSGFVSVNFSSLRATSLFNNEGSTFDRLRLFVLPGYPLLPQDGYCDSCAMREVALGVAFDDSNDTKFNSNSDAFFFYAQGPNGWGSDFDAGYADSVYLNHPYETKNYYYLTLSPNPNDPAAPPVPGTPQRIATDATRAPLGSEAAVTSFPDRVHFEEDNASEYWPDAAPGESTYGWEKWFWASITQGGSFEYTFDLPDADLTQTARFRLRDWGVTDNKASFNETPCGNLGYDHYLDVAFNGVTFPRKAFNGYVYDPGYNRQAVVNLDSTDAQPGTSDFLRTTNNVLHLSVPRLTFADCTGRVDQSALAWFEIYYRHLLRPQKDSLVFVSPGAAGPYRYSVGPFVKKTPPRLFDVTDPQRPVEILVRGDAMWDTTTRTLFFADTASVTHRYRIVPDSVISIARLASGEIADVPLSSYVENLRSTTAGADYVVIYYDGFSEAATALAEAREQSLPIVEHAPPYLTKAVPISAVYDQFSGGRTDPSAIRNFLRAAFVNWRVRPKFVLLLGDASYDYKNLKGQAATGRPGCLLPTFENDYDATPTILRQFVTDDRLMNVTDSTSYIPDFFGGRLPANDAQAALDVVQKLVRYESSAPMGEYRNAVVLLADDDVQGERCDNKLNWQHLQQTDDLNLHHIPSHMDRDYVYLHTYATGAGSTKPGARAALKSYLNGGVALFNYIGHGSPFKITDESVFIDSDAGQLQNGDKLFAFVAASCDVGKFNDPTVSSLGEQIVMTSKGGAFAVISATEQALSGSNVNLAKYMFDQIFNRGNVIAGYDTLTGVGQYHVPFSAALVAAKILAPGTGTTNNRKYQLMGDPAVTPNLPHYWSELSLFDTDGNPITQVARGQTVVFHGRVLDQPGGTPIASSGQVNVLIEDSAPTNSTRGNGWDVGCYGERVPATYRYAAGPMYHGNVTVTGGVFEGRFVVPMDATLGALGRVRAYAQGTSPADAKERDGVGAITTTLVAGTPPATDTKGPEITLRFDGGSQSVRPDATLRIDLRDDSGIMTTAHAPQNSIIVTLDDNTTSRTDVTSSYRCAADAYQHGIATFKLPNVATGHHKVTVSAADNLATGITAAQHRSSASLEFDVVDHASLRIAHAFVFPNPIRSEGAGAGGTFVVDARGDSLNAMVRIFTVSGRVVRTLSAFGRIGQVQLPWDGLDAEGEPLANGTYLFKVYANARDADGSSSPLQEDARVGRFVVLNR